MSDSSEHSADHSGLRFELSWPSGFFDAGQVTWRQVTYPDGVAAAEVLDGLVPTTGASQ